ncbi:hypothetical protein [Gilliamella mensalis]|uniref:hypothetical protein n=1 Tax=Gilliamella mensalis TaxID=1908520 RepID=UPI000A146C1E|nr:hypothetical protein [Gilliamella mensalis]
MGFRNWFFSKIYVDNKKIKHGVLETNAKLDRYSLQLSDFIENFYSIKKDENEKINQLLQHKFFLECKIKELEEKLDLVSNNYKLINGLNNAVNILTEKNISLHNDIFNLKQTVNLISTNRLINKDTKITCLFLVHNIESWDGTFSVYKLMLTHQKFNVIVASINRRYPGSQVFKDEEYVHNILSDLGVPHLRLNNINSYDDLTIIKTLAPNIIFRQSQWDNDIPPAFSTDNLRFAKLCLIPYEIMNFVQLGFNHLSSYYHTSCWKLFVANQQTKIEQEQHDKLNGLNVFVTGHPKVKALKNAAPIWPIVSETKEKKFRVLWASHHSVDKNWSNFSVFLDIYNYMLNWAKEDKSIEFVFSPHPALVTVLEAITDEALKKNIQEFFDEWNQLDNTYVYRNGPYGTLFQSSDILIMDGISWLLEYQLMKKPLIFIEREDHSPFTINGELIASGTNRVRTVEQARELAYMFKRGEPDPNRKNQDIVVDTLLSIENAADNIISSMLEDIKSW